MKTRTTIHIVLLLHAFLASSVARLGETVAECEKRYGAGEVFETETMDQALSHMGRRVSLITGAPHKLYNFQGWLIKVAFVDGVSVAEQYTKDSTRSKIRITDAELAVILDANKGDGAWAKEEDGNTWIRTDKTIAEIATTDSIRTGLKLTTPAAIVADAKGKNQKLESEKAKVPKF
jgi:hypothetical protein